MTAGLVAAPAGPRAVRAGARARRPERWLHLVASTGWAVLVLAEADRLAGGGHPSGHSSHADLPSTAGASWLHHGVLTVAMVAVMLPLIAPNVRYAALRSPRASRGAVTVAVVTGWASVWVVAGSAAGVLGALASEGGYAAMLGVTALALGWQWSRTRRRSVARCHRVVAPPLDPAAARAAGRSFGRSLGRDCATACLPLMLLMAVFAHALVVTVPVAWVAWYERRRRPHHDLAPGWTAAVLAVAGGLGTAMAAVGLG